MVDLGWIDECDDDDKDDKDDVVGCEMEFCPFLDNCALQDAYTGSNHHARWRCNGYAYANNYVP